MKKEIHTMDKINKRIGNLLSVKSLVTLILTAIFAVMALRGDIGGKDFLTSSSLLPQAHTVPVRHNIIDYTGNFS